MGSKVLGFLVLGTLAVSALGNQEPRTSEPRTSDSLFRFQNNFWVNLHHVVRREARRRVDKQAPTIKLEQLSESERAAWSSALDAYATLSQKTIFLDPQTIAINNTLTTVPDDGSPDGRGLDPNITSALMRAAPIYRAHYWVAHRQINERWIAAVQSMIAQHGSAMAREVAKAYRVVWPAQPIVVDASADAGPLGGYTTDGPPGTAAHTVIQSDNPEYQGEMAFEMVFHEASHATGIFGPTLNALQREAQRQHVTLPRDLWHVLLFYTAGELARRELGMIGDAHYMPYAYRYGVYSGGWETLRDAVVAEWQPYLDGARTYDAAIAALVAANQ
ncbi:MAG TPA: hypothetical protein VFA59_21125 [Vicinamibacterales bacterium]|nr:hypothetical protein [Vicinamibacterales bacterium]